MRRVRVVEAYQIEILLTLSLALGGYAAETLRLSAPLEAVAAGLALRRFNMDISMSRSPTNP
jgi:CPA1 family monovalent cation:H+ antiporter